MSQIFRKSRKQLVESLGECLKAGSRSKNVGLLPAKLLPPPLVCLDFSTREFPVAEGPAEGLMYVQCLFSHCCDEVALKNICMPNKESPLG